MYWICKVCNQRVNVSVYKQYPRTGYVCYVCEGKKKPNGAATPVGQTKKIHL